MDAHVSNLYRGATTTAHVHVVPSAAEVELDLLGFGRRGGVRAGRALERSWWCIAVGGLREYAADTAGGLAGR